MIFRIIRFGALLFYNLFYPHKIFGKQNLIKEGKSVVICNHYCKMDVIMMEGLYKDKTYFLAKKEWFDNKFLGFLARKCGAIPVDRDNVDFTSMKACLKVLKDNKRLGVFPEGTRNKAGTKELLPFKGGAGLIAFKGKAPIVPVLMYAPIKMFKKNYIIVGEPISLEKYEGQKFTSELSDEITNMLVEVMVDLRSQLEVEINKSKKVK